jgi:multisubunit Na+/H+ antiporter MnhE subunit
MRGRVGAWLVWWVLLMSFWMILDGSAAPDEVLAGAGVAAIAALFAQWVCVRAGVSFTLRIRARWLAAAARLPWAVLRDTGVIMVALWRRVASGEQPASRLRELPFFRNGETGAELATQRVLLVAGRSVAPNTLAVDLQGERDVLLVHELVPASGKAPG